MRIVSGTLRGRRVEPPDSFQARPTTDFAKENLFNVLANFVDFEGSTVMDLFAGSGSIGYEFASRGCPHVTAVEKRPAHAQFIRATARRLGLDGILDVRLADALKEVARPGHYDIVFADPPYDLPEVDTLPDLALAEPSALKPGGLLIVEHSIAGRFNTHPHFWQTRAYGKVNFTLFRKPQ